MFSPNDKGLKFPLKWRLYHGRVVITSDEGYELFQIEMIRPSIEAKRWLEEWAQMICEKLSKIESIGSTDPVVKNIFNQLSESNKKIDETRDSLVIEGTKPIILKKKRGRPLGSFKKKK